MRLSSLRGLIPLAAVLGLWELLGDSKSPTTPSPSAWWPAFVRAEESGALWQGLRRTLELFAEGLVIAALIGITLGVALGASKRLSQALGPLLEFLRTTPAAALVPAAILVFGLKDRTVIGIIVYGTVWPILLNVAGARAALAPLRLEVAHSLHLSWFERMRKIILPSLVPDIVTGIRVATPICLIMTLLVDFLMSAGGLGYLLVQYQNSYDGSGAFAMIAFIGILGLLISLLIGYGQRLALRRWPTAAQH